MTLLTRLSAALFFAVLAGAALAAGTPVKITADSFTVDSDRQRATFTGNVEITRTGMTMWAQTVVVVYGSGGEGDIDALTATGGVRIKTAGQDASGSRATFDPDTMLVRLSGDVTVINAQGTVKGPELTINLATNISTFKGSDGGRVTGVFTPQ